MSADHPTPNGVSLAVSSWRPSTWHSRSNTQFFVGLALALAVPAFVFIARSTRFWSEATFTTSFALAAIAVLMGYQFQRRLVSFPDVGAGARVLTGMTAAYGLTLAVASLLRSDYSTVFLSVSYLTALFWFVGMALWRSRYKQVAMAILDAGHIPEFETIPGVTFTRITSVVDYDVAMGPLVMDLRHDHDDATLELVAQLVLEGTVVLHTKRAFERLAGRVSIQHLSENEFGSLLPEQFYLRVKPTLDWLAALVLAPVFAVVLAPIIVMMLIAQGRPIFYVQKRRGLRGTRFPLYKLRTMKAADVDPAATQQQRLDALLTQPKDPRVTRFGRFLRRHRIDELPQIWNILRGDMSWVGPRPEAAALSEEYQRRLPFYAYRHVVKPGVTGWAQVHTGHVTDLEATGVKLEYDFYYIKMVSPWLDLLVLVRTVWILVRGIGSR